MYSPCHQLQTDVLVIGAGGAGCQAAMVASDLGATVTLIDKGRLGLSGATYDAFTWGKGITVAVSGFNMTDDPEDHCQKAMEAARGLANPALARLVAYEAPQRFRELLEVGFPFRANRLGACFGKGLIGAVIDQPDLAQSFRREIARRPIRLLERTMALRLLGDGRRCTGAGALQPDGEILAISAAATILATGGASSMFRYNFAGPELTGDGHVLALEAGAALANLEFYQAILGTTGPVSLFFPQWFLAGKPRLTTVEGHDFLANYLPVGADPGGLLYERSLHGPFTSSLPSGQVDLAITSEIMAGRGTAPPGDRERLAGVWCDFAGLPDGVRRELDGRFGRPALAWLRSKGMDLEAGPVAIAPFAHAFNGGIVIDEHGRTAVPGLYACGEVAAGPHGANRVGGHMLSVLLVFGARAGRHAAESAASAPRAAPDGESVASAGRLVAALNQQVNAAGPSAVRRAVQEALSPAMIAKDEVSLGTALAELERIGGSSRPSDGAVSPTETAAALGVANLRQMAELVVRSAQLRRESRGPHYRTDFPKEEESFGNRSLVWERKEGVLVSHWASLAEKGQMRA